MIAGVLTVGSGLFFSVPAMASTPHPSTGTLVTAPMTLDCVHMAPQVRAYADAHNYCPKGSGVTPDNVVPGNCGWSSLFINGQGNGWITIKEAAYSYQGTIVSVTWNVNWYNWSIHHGWYVGGFSWLPPWSNPWNHTDYAWTNFGWITATMTGHVGLIWGGSCSFNIPSSSSWS
jgi:hypothetical protein